MATVDEEIAQSMTQVLNMGSTCAAAAGAIVAATKGTLLVLILPLMYIYRGFQSHFRFVILLYVQCSFDVRVPSGR